MTPARGLVAVLSAAVLALLPAASATASPTPDREPKPSTPIQHFVMLMQENHSFDNYFGTYPGAEGIPENACMPVDPPGGNCTKPFHIGNRSLVDPPHQAEIASAQYAGGRMNGFVSAMQGSAAGDLVMGYYDQRDIPYYWKVAREYALFDRFFTSALSGSFTNHMYWVTGSSGGTLEDEVPEGGFGDLPTIFDRLDERGISWKFYVKDYDPKVTYRSRALGARDPQVQWVPLLSYDRYIDDPKLSSHIVDLDEYYKDLRNGTLPSVAYIVPSGASEHPPGSIRAGENFVRTLINGLMRSDAWDSSAFMWTYDDWGGFYDHVRPPQVDRFGYGFRAPALLVSPYARRGHIESSTLDFTSMLRFIEDNWDLEPLAQRDRRANSIAGAFDFSQPARPAAFLSTSPEVPPTGSRPVIYAAYGGALGLTALMIAWAGMGMPVPRRRASGVPRRRVAIPRPSVAVPRVFSAIPRALGAIPPVSRIIRGPLGAAAPVRRLGVSAAGVAGSTPTVLAPVPRRTRNRLGALRRGASRGVGALLRSSAVHVSALAVAGLALQAVFAPESWMDDSVRVEQAKAPFGDMVDELRVTDQHPPFHHALLWVLVRLFEHGDVALRGAALVAGTLLVPALYLAGRELAGRRAGLAAAALGALAPVAAAAWPEARVYPFFLLFAAASVWGQARAIRRERPLDWLVYAAVTVAMVWTHYAGVALIVAEQAVFAAVAWRRAAGRRPLLPLLAGCWVTSLAITIALLPLVPLAQDQLFGDRPLPGSNVPALEPALEPLP